MAKQLFHKELRDMSPISVTVKAERQKSTYSKPNAPKPDYVTLMVNGEERYYTTENEACAQFFNGKHGQTFTVVAEGSREDATITCVGQSAATLQQPAARQPTTNPTPPQAPPETKAVNHEKEAGMYIAHRLAGQKLTLRATMALAKEFEAAYGMTLSDDWLQSINSTLFIAGDRAGMFANLPVTVKFPVK